MIKIPSLIKRNRTSRASLQAVCYTPENMGRMRESERNRARERKRERARATERETARSRARETLSGPETARAYNITIASTDSKRRRERARRREHTRCSQHTRSIRGEGEREQNGESIREDALSVLLLCMIYLLVGKAR